MDKKTMCGITGIFSLNPSGNEEKIVTSMNDMLVHRGPDGEGYYNNDMLFLGMRRLSIIDIKGGHQPIYNEDESVVIVLNGEIYNFIELRKDLIKKGHIFKTNTDTEVIVHLYEEKGIKALDDLNGMFVFCLWDNNRKKGYLVRDRLGIKQLYYSIHNNSIFFASELKALKFCPLSFDIDDNAIMTYLRYMYIPAPLTPFKNIHKMLPATYISFSEKGIENPKEYWWIQTENNSNIKSNLKTQFLQLIENSINLQLRSDVAVGMFLSGGIDSSMITYFASKKIMGDVYTFSVKYQGAKIDETIFAEQIAKKFNCKHKSIEVKLEDVNNELPRILWYMDEPFADSAMVGTHEISKLAAEYVKVILNGTGGDELFAGYQYYLPIPKYRKKLKSLKNFIEKVITPESQNKFGNINYIHFLFSNKECRKFNTNSLQDNIDWYFMENNNNTTVDDINKLLFSDVTFNVPNDLLNYLDKMTMASSIEGRVPILDHRLVEWAFQIQGEFKIADKELKHLLKKWLVEILPNNILNRTKQGFGAPVKYWMENGLLDECIRLIDKRPMSRDNLYWGLHGNKLKHKLHSMNRQKSFALLNLEIWFRLFVDENDFNVSINEIKN